MIFYLLHWVTRRILIIFLYQCNLATAIGSQTALLKEMLKYIEITLVIILLLFLDYLSYFICRNVPFRLDFLPVRRQIFNATSLAAQNAKKALEIGIGEIDFPLAFIIDGMIVGVPLGRMQCSSNKTLKSFLERKREKKQGFLRQFPLISIRLPQVLY